MQAIIVLPGGKLELTEVPDPGELDPAHILVRVRATAVNRADLLQARGLYPVPPGQSEILGLEAAGEVVETKAGFEKGTRVAALLGGGGYAELVSVPASHVLRLPDTMSFEEAASIPEAWITAYLNLIHLGRLRAGETALITSPGSGVGVAAIQLAKHWGATVWAVGRTQAKLEQVEQLGASKCFLLTGPETYQRIELEAGQVDLILDMIGAEHFQERIGVLKKHGRLVLIGLLGGAKSELNLSRVLMQNLTLSGSTLRDKSLEEKSELIAGFCKDVWSGFTSGKLKPIIDRSFSLKEAALAHEYVAKNQNFGKVLLIP